MVDNIDVRSLLRAAAATVRLGVRISGCGPRRLRARVLGWTGGNGGTGRLGHEWFNKVLVSTHIGYVRVRSLRPALVPLEPVLIRDVGCLVNRIRARVAPDFRVSIADKEACDGDANDRTEHKTANAGSYSCADGDAGSPGRNVRYSTDRDRRQVAYLVLEERHVSSGPDPLCMGPFVHEAPLASVRVR